MQPSTAPTMALLPVSGTKTISNRQSSRITNNQNTLETKPFARSKKRKERLKNQRSRSDYDTRISTNKTDQSTVLWAVLLLGILLCLVDVLYVMLYVHSQSPTVTATVAKGGGNDARDNNDRQNDARDNDASDDPRKGKERILQILAEAGIYNVDNETARELPTWEQVTSLYGDHPRIYGLDTCEAFQNRSDPAEHFVGTAGAFNSGTNLLSELMIHNCHMTARMKRYGGQNRGVRWQVPWGKHNPPSDEEYRQSHKTKKDWNVDANNILPAVTIRDPYMWMGSMCRHHYEAMWPHRPEHCPNLVPSEYDKAIFPWTRQKDSLTVRVRYGTDLEIRKQHDSLAHMWNEWYDDYIYADFPRVIVRVEDLVFYPKEVTATVCKCAGGDMNHHQFKYVVDSAKKGFEAHGKVRTSLMDAMIRYGTDKERFKGYTREDLQFAKESLNRDRMEFFGYTDPPVRLLE